MARFAHFREGEAMSDQATAKRLNGWQALRAEQRSSEPSSRRRFSRWKALRRGDANPIFQPFSKRLTPDFQEAIDRYVAEKKRKAG
jgi:hypothetical protein